MIGLPAATMYHRWVGWHAPALRRFAVAAVLGLIVFLALWRFLTWELSVLGGWDAAAVVILATVGPIVLGADGDRTEHLAMREDETRATTSVLLIGASVASLLAVGFVLGQAGREAGGLRVLLVGVATVTVLLSWTLVNTVFTLRYAHLYFSAPPTAVDFGNGVRGEQPDYRDFAYLAFTIGMTYQVSDTALRDRQIRRTVLLHALLSYLFGVVIVAAGINLVAGLVR
jgi:uncharacterized membrane protein